MEIFETIARERRALADLVDTLSPEQLRAPSLVPTWTVHDVVGHLILGLEPPLLRFALELLATRSMDKATDRLTWRIGRRPVPELTAVLRRKAASRSTPPGFGPVAPLTEVVVHGLDLRRALGIAWSVPEEPARTVLDFLVGPKSRGFARPSWRRDVRFEATDLDWSHGDGPLLRGLKEPIILAVAGRAAALADLEGDGVRVLRDRFCGV